eukprot:1140925-Pelagomonas_calceolata.AAC.2
MGEGQQVCHAINVEQGPVRQAWRGQPWPALTSPLSMNFIKPAQGTYFFCVLGLCQPYKPKLVAGTCSAVHEQA